MTEQLGLFGAPKAPALEPTSEAPDTRDWRAWNAAWDASDVTAKTKHGSFSRNRFVDSCLYWAFRAWDRFGWFEAGGSWADGLWRGADRLGLDPASVCLMPVDDVDGPRLDLRAVMAGDLWHVGDALQALDNAAVKTFAFCQTPDFVCDFILDRCLDPAMAEFGADVVRVVDPSCGTGHFLVKALARIVDRLIDDHDMAADEAVLHALPRVWGVDLNPCALRLARARLVLAAMRLRSEVSVAEMRHGDDLAPLAKIHESDALLGMPLEGFHVVVGNPPYIVEPDRAKREAHKKRYVSAYMKYSLGAVFTERCFQIAAPGGFVGILTANSFMKREFGKALVEKVLPKVDLTHVIDTSGAYLHGHGTPTVILVGRNRPPSSDKVRAVLAKRGEPKTPYAWDPIGKLLGVTP